MYRAIYLWLAYAGMIIFYGSMISFCQLFAGSTCYPAMPGCSLSSLKLFGQERGHGGSMLTRPAACLQCRWYCLQRHMRQTGDWFDVQAELPGSTYIATTFLLPWVRI
jgi:hypothetical protein